MACENKAHVHSNWRDAYARSCKSRRKACESTFAILAATPNLDKLIIAPAALVILTTPCCRPDFGFASLSLLRADFWRLSMFGLGSQGIDGATRLACDKVLVQWSVRAGLVGG